MKKKDDKGYRAFELGMDCAYDAAFAVLDMIALICKDQFNCALGVKTSKKEKVCFEKAFNKGVDQLADKLMSLAMAAPVMSENGVSLALPPAKKAKISKKKTTGTPSGR